MLAKAWRQLRERPFAGVVVSLAIHLAILAALLWVGSPSSMYTVKRGEPLFVELPQADEPAQRGSPPESQKPAPPAPRVAAPPPRPASPPTRPEPRAREWPCLRRGPPSSLHRMSRPLLRSLRARRRHRARRHPGWLRCLNPPLHPTSARRCAGADLVRPAPGAGVRGGRASRVSRSRWTRPTRSSTITSIASGG